MASLQERVQTALGDWYRIERELGRGGMATVFLAQDLKHERPVALKVLHPDIAANLGAERFRQEIDFVAHLNHPHILALFDSGHTAGLFWYVMPFVEGESLRQRLDRQRTLSLSEAADIARQAATALDYAHQHGVIHRDIKPENLLLAHDHVWVADFGIARALWRSGTDRSTGTFVVGTPPYMSPEQTRMEELDGRSDLYSLATVVYEALAGAVPYPGNTPWEVAARRELGPPPALRTIRPDLPAAATAAVHRALSADPADRQATAGAFASELSGAVSSPEMVRAVKKASRRSVWRTAAVIAGLAVAAYLILRPSPPPPWDDRRVLILPPEVGDSAMADFGEDVATALETQLRQARALLPVSPPADLLGGPGRPGLDTSATRLRSLYRNRFTVATRIMTAPADSLRLAVWVTDASRTLSQPAPTVVVLPAGTGPWQAAFAVARYLLPILLPTGGELDPAMVGSQSVEAVSDFLLGERAYRHGEWATADSLFGEAVAADSTYAWAALRGAQAASWNSEHQRAIDLITTAKVHLRPLGRRVIRFADGLLAYQEGRADDAVASLSAALGDDPQWPEAWMALGDVYYHLLPRADRVFDRAVAAFDSARKYDPGFAPPLHHQFQLAVWQPQPHRADSLLAVMLAALRDSTLVARAELTLRACLREGGLSALREAARNPERLGTLRAVAIDLAGAGLEQGPCARQALGQSVAVDSTSGYARYLRWARAHVLAAQGRRDSAVGVLLSNLTDGDREVLLLMFAMAGHLPRGVADSVADELTRREVDPLVRLSSEPRDVLTPTPGQVRRLWAVASWEVSRGRWGPALAVENLLSGIAAADSVGADARRLAGLFARSLQARRLVAAGDSAGALAVLDSLVPNATQQYLRWRPWESLPYERLLRARLLEAAGRIREAWAEAESFDSPASYGLLLHLRESLEFRIRLAPMLGYNPLGRRLEERLAALRS